MTPEKAYEILDKKYPIPYTDWNDPKDVERRRKEIENELRADFQREHELSDADLQKVVDHNCYIIKDNCYFEHLYAKYAGSTKVTVLEHEYCNAFCMMVYAKGDESEWHDGYKWFNRVSIHWAFVVTNASEESIIFSNQKLFEIYSSVINSDSFGKEYAGIGNARELTDLWSGNMWKDKVYNLFEIVLAWYNKRLDMIQAKIEHHKINKHHK